MKANIWTDGACKGNPGPCSIAFIIVPTSGAEIKKYDKMGIGTNNIAEITCIIEAMKCARKHGIDTIHVRSDSTLALGLIFGTWRAKALHLKKLQFEAKTELSNFTAVSSEYCPRGLGRIPECDYMAELALTRK